MTPNTDERLASVIRSLTEVVLPHLPADASLAQEQVHLAVGHLQILRMQLDATPAFEREEGDDALALAAELAAAIDGGDRTRAAVAALGRAAAADSGDARAGLRNVNRAIEALVSAVSADGSEASRGALSRIILDHERRRVDKDRRWFLPFGFDTMETGA